MTLGIATFVWLCGGILSTLRGGVGTQSWLHMRGHFCAELASETAVIHAELATHSYKSLYSFPYRGLDVADSAHRPPMTVS